MNTPDDTADQIEKALAGNIGILSVVIANPETPEFTREQAKRAKQSAVDALGAMFDARCAAKRREMALAE